jgi:type IV fimbrial biogenesis protein FimT
MKLGSAVKHSSRTPAADSPSRVRGFTLLELMATLTVAAIILTVGVPSFVSLMQNTRATTHTNALVTALNIARSEATRRGTAVTVCSSTTGTSCAGAGVTDWSTGWIVSTPAQVLRAWPQVSGGATLTGDAGQIQFQPRGSVDAARTLRVRVPNCTGDQGRDLALNIAGRISVTRVAC